VDHLIVKLKDDADIKAVLTEHLGDSVDNRKEMIVQNGSADPLCPYFRLIMTDYTVTSPINYKLETFFINCGILGIHARCSVAVVVGMMSQDINSCVDVPYEYRYSYMSRPGYSEPVHLQPSQSIMRKKCLDKLMGVQGMCLPFQLPSSVHWQIFKWLRHPCAEMIWRHKQKMMAWCAYWDNHFAYVIRSSDW
jgi:hypothetical protein